MRARHRSSAQRSVAGLIQWETCININTWTCDVWLCHAVESRRYRSAQAEISQHVAWFRNQIKIHSRITGVRIDESDQGLARFLIHAVSWNTRLAGRSHQYCARLVISNKNDLGTSVEGIGDF